MFYFYDSSSFNLVTCPPPRLSSAKEKAPSLACAPSLARNFLDADMMRSLSCFLQWVVFSSHPSNKSKKHTPRLDPLRWVQNALTKGKKGGSGAVSRTLALDGRVELVLKKALHKDEAVEFTHEYIVALYGTNHLRALCPNFGYTMALYKSKGRNADRLAMESIPGPQIIAYLTDLNKQPFSEAAMLDFLKMWIQVVLALEVAQETFCFTHFDLHGQNVLCRPVNPPLPFLEYLVMDQVYRLESVATVATVIDYGHATIRYDKGFIGQKKDGFPQFGMYPFYVPGADLFKLVAYLWNSLYQKPCGDQTMGKRLGVFFEFMWDKFFGAASFPLKAVADSYYNGTELPSAFYSPYDMLQFFQQRRSEILGILGVSTYPWSTIPVSPAFTLYKTLKYRKKETYACYQSLFCSAIEPMPRNLYHLTTRDTDTDLTPEELQTVLTKRVPVLTPSNAKDVDNFLKPASLWDKFTGRIDFLWTQTRKHGTPFPPGVNLTACLYYYRAYVCLEGYKSYLHHES